MQKVPTGSTGLDKILKDVYPQEGTTLLKGVSVLPIADTSLNEQKQIEMQTMESVALVVQKWRER